MLENPQTNAAGILSTSLSRYGFSNTQVVTNGIFGDLKDPSVVKDVDEYNIHTLKRIEGSFIFFLKGNRVAITQSYDWRCIGVCAYAPTHFETDYIYVNLLNLD